MPGIPMRCPFCGEELLVIGLHPQSLGYCEQCQEVVAEEEKP